jgi:hypothetical protein
MVVVVLRLGGPKEVINSPLPASSLLYICLSSADHFPFKIPVRDDCRSLREWVCLAAWVEYTYAVDQPAQRCRLVVNWLL